jgi:uncharacterized protein (DUF849 family)
LEKEGAGMNKLIIEVRMNENAPKSANPNVPYTSAEIAADAIACAGAGAAAVHFHARHADGSESNDPEHYKAAIGAIRERCDVLIHTTLGMFRGAAPEARLAHIEAMVKETNLRPDVAPLDMGSNNIDFWDPAAKAFQGEGFVYTNSTRDLTLMAERLKAWGVKPQASLWTLSHARLMGGFRDAGLLDGPVWALCYLCGERWLFGHPATSAGLRAFTDNLPAGDVEWSVLGLDVNMLRMAPEIIAQGGHISLGLGDHAYDELGRPSNAELVRKLVAVAGTMGREVATPREARAILGI